MHNQSIINDMKKQLVCTQHNEFVNSNVLGNDCTSNYVQKTTAFSQTERLCHRWLNWEDIQNSY